MGKEESKAYRCRPQKETRRTSFSARTLHFCWLIARRKSRRTTLTLPSQQLAQVVSPLPVLPQQAVMLPRRRPRRSLPPLTTLAAVLVACSTTTIRHHII